jgi:signal transduction histidine kinase
MLRNRSFRTKMLAVTMAPLVVLIVFAALLVRPEIAATQAAADNQRGAAYAELNVKMVAGLENERDLSSWWVASKSQEVRAELEKARGISDELSTKLLAYSGQVPSSLRFVEVESSKAVRDLGSLRTSVDGDEMTASRANSAYSLRIDSLIKSTRALADQSSSLKLSHKATALSELVEAQNQLSVLRGEVVAKLESNRLTSSDLAEVLTREEAYKSGIARYRLTVSDSDGERLTSLLGTEEIAKRDIVYGTIVADLQTEQSSVKANDWWGTHDALFAALNQFTVSELTAYRSSAGEASSSASQTALIFAVSAIGSALIAALVALSLARTMTNRLSSLAEQARIIASEKLPEVLSALRNPTADAVSGALPTVRSDSNDELGIMAESFNKVLHTSVKTSLEHSQQRSATVTNMLVNLGRRNQSLIDRQLKIMDRLEAKEEDPDTLEALYEVDHLVTRMRRNAENLLVLSGQKQARTWAKPVTLYDVLRSAASEVSDLNRAVIGEVAPELIMSGPFAVDVSHLLAELVENATRYSPKTTAVSLTIDEKEDTVNVWISDSGVGMSEEEFATANERLAHPPEIDELATDRVGFQVVGRLARKLNVGVAIGPNVGGGVAAVVKLPHSLFESQNKSGDNSRTEQRSPNSVGAALNANSTDASPSTTANSAPPGRPKQVAAKDSGPKDSATAAPGSAKVGSQKVGLRASSVDAPQRTVDTVPQRSSEGLPQRSTGATPPAVVAAAAAAKIESRLPGRDAQPGKAPVAPAVVAPAVVAPAVVAPVVVAPVVVAPTEAPAATAPALPIRAKTPAEPTVAAEPKVDVAALATEAPATLPTRRSAAAPAPTHGPAPAAADSAAPAEVPAPAAALPKRGDARPSDQQREGFGRLPEVVAKEGSAPSPKASTFASFQQLKQRTAETLGSPASTDAPAPKVLANVEEAPTAAQPIAMASAAVAAPVAQAVVAPAVVATSPDVSDAVLAEPGAIATATPAAAPATEPLTTRPGGLVQRRPGKVFGDAAQAADSGEFKRLGNGNEERPVDSVSPSTRFAALSRLQRGVTTARSSDSTDQAPTSPEHTNPGDLS